MSGTLLTALIALVSAGLALFFQLRPDLRPDPRTQLGAMATVFAVDDGVTLGEFLGRRKPIVSEKEFAAERAVYRREAAGSAPLTSGDSIFRTPGEDVFVRTAVEGFKSRSIVMQASMYNARTGRRVPQLSDFRVFQQQLESPSDQSVVEFWLATPPVQVSKYFIRVELYHRGDGVLLAVADSKPVIVSLP